MSKLLNPENFGQLQSPSLRLDIVKSNDIANLYSTLVSPTTWMSVERGVTDESSFSKYMTGFFVRQEKGEGVTIVARIRSTLEIAAISTFWNPSLGLTKIEIGFTWVADKWMRSFVNTELKLAMMTYAFEHLNVKRVEFSVDPRNEKSNVAMKRLGATFEGTLRKWRFLSTNDKGDRNIYSVIDDEWPGVKSRIESLLVERQT